MLNRYEIEAIVADLEYKDWEFYLGEMGDGYYLQMRFDAPDSETGKLERQHCRKWYISKHMTRTEVVDTAYKAVEAGVLHEMQEEFKYSGLPIRNPHTSVDARMVACQQTEHRAAPPQKEYLANTGGWYILEGKMYDENDTCMGPFDSESCAPHRPTSCPQKKLPWRDRVKKFARDILDKEIEPRNGYKH